MVHRTAPKFCMGWFDAIIRAVDIVRAAVAFAPVDNDIAAATAHLTRLSKARIAASLSTDAATLAELEMDYWIVQWPLADRARLHQTTSATLSQ